MSVLIKGMSKPTECNNCDFVQHGATKDWCYITEKGIPCECPLVLVPPHGRLIDADALVRDNGIKEIPEYYEVVRDAPTIIEAEEGET